jgi:hypothetical protein
LTSVNKSNLTPDERLQQARRAMARHGRVKPQTDLPDLDFAHSPAWLGRFMEISGQQKEAERLKLVQQLESELADPKTDEQQRDLVRLALEFLGVRQFTSGAPQAFPGTTKETKVMALAANLQRCIGHLEKLADTNDPAAVSVFARHALRVCEHLSELRKRHPKLLIPVARESIFWPVLKSPCIHFDETQAKLDPTHAILLDDLEVGRGNPIQGQKWKPSDTLSALVTSLFEEIRGWKAGVNIIAMTWHDENNWRTEAMNLTELARDYRTLKMWGKVMLSLLHERYPTNTGLVRAYGHLVKAPSKREQGEGAVASQLRSMIVERFSEMLGLKRGGREFPERSGPRNRHRAGRSPVGRSSGDSDEAVPPIKQFMFRNDF